MSKFKELKANDTSIILRHQPLQTLQTVTNLLSLNTRKAGNNKLDIVFGLVRNKKELLSSNLAIPSWASRFFTGKNFPGQKLPIVIS